MLYPISIRVCPQIRVLRVIRGYITASLLHLGNGTLEGIYGDRIMRFLPDSNAAFDQDGLRALVPNAYPLGKAEGDGPFLDHADKGEVDLLGFRGGQKLLPRTVGSGRNRSGGRVLEDEQRPVRRRFQHSIEVCHG